MVDRTGQFDRRITAASVTWCIRRRAPPDTTKRHPDASQVPFLVLPAPQPLVNR